MASELLNELRKPRSQLAVREQWVSFLLCSLPDWNTGKLIVCDHSLLRHLRLLSARART